MSDGQQPGICRNLPNHVQRPRAEPVREFEITNQKQHKKTGSTQSQRKKSFGYIKFQYPTTGTDGGVPYSVATNSRPVSYLFFFLLLSPLYWSVCQYETVQIKKESLRVGAAFVRDSMARPLVPVPIFACPRYPAGCPTHVQGSGIGSRGPPWCLAETFQGDNMCQRMQVVRLSESER